MPEWRMLVWEPDGTSRATINVDGPIARLDRFDVNGAGNCLEAAWIADPQSVTIKARDVIRLDAREDSGDAWTSVYKGFVTTAGSSRAESLQDYRAVGLKQRFYELFLEEFFITGADVATMVDDVLTAITLPEGVAYSSSDVPTLDFQLGDRYPNLENLGELLDAFAGTVGRFIVPTGESYTYDGTTYNAGDIVPAVQWGVDGNGDFFFRRPQASALTVSEGDVGVRVQWQPVDAEESIDTVYLVYATEPAEGADFSADATNVNQAPVWRQFTSGEDFASALSRTLDAPLDYMGDDVQSHSSSDVTDEANAFDGDSGTYAETTSGSATLTATASSQASGSGWGGIARLRFRVPSDATIRVRLAAFNSSTGLSPLLHYYDVEGTSSDEIELLLPILWTDRYGGVPAGDEPRVTLEDMPSGTRIYRLEIYVPDVDVGETGSETLADGLMKDPNSEVSEVELVDSLGGVSQDMSLTPSGESAVEVPVERIEYSLTGERGLVTRYHLGQPYSAELMAQKVVLERLARRATS